MGNKKSGMGSRNCHKTIAIIGGGFSGIAFVSNMLKQKQLVSHNKKLKLILIEKTAFAKGSVGKTSSPVHLLNIRALHMSAFPENPLHFHHWLQSQGYSKKLTDFVPRPLYAKYMESILNDAEKLATKDCVLEKKIAEVIALHPQENQYKLFFQDGKDIQVDAVILAMGNFSCDRLPINEHEYLNHSGYISDPWGVLPEIPLTNNIAVIGTGLSSVDKLLELHYRKHQGKIHAISRRALLPPTRSNYFFNDDLSLFFFENSHDVSLDFNWTARGILRAFQAARKKGISFEEFTIYLLYKLQNQSKSKYSTQVIWNQFSYDEQLRIIRHLKRYISLLLHAAPSQSMEKIEQMKEEGQLHLHAAQLKKVSCIEKGFNLTFSKRFSDKFETIFVDTIINCLGPFTRPEQCSNPLISQLFRDKLIRLDRYGNLLDTSPNLQVIDQEGNTHTSFYALGALKKHPLHGAKAVPSIAIEARDLVSHLLKKYLKNYKE